MQFCRSAPDREGCLVTVLGFHRLRDQLGRVLTIPQRMQGAEWSLWRLHLPSAAGTRQWCLRPPSPAVGHDGQPSERIQEMAEGKNEWAQCSLIYSPILESACPPLVWVMAGKKCHCGATTAYSPLIQLISPNKT